MAHSVTAQPVSGVIPSIPTPQGLKLPRAVTDHLGKACVNRDSARPVIELDMLFSWPDDDEKSLVFCVLCFGYKQKMVAF